MSVVLLTTGPDTLSVVRARDPSAACLPQDGILANKEAVLCKATFDTLFPHEFMERPTENTKRTELDIGEGWVLRVTHIDSVMGPTGFKNIGVDEYPAPWGIWILYNI